MREVLRPIAPRAILLIAAATAGGCDPEPAARLGCASPAADLGLLPTGDARGAIIVEARGCRNCHDPGDGSLSGGRGFIAGTQSVAPNLTPDRDTGIGNWSDAELARAIRDGLDREGRPLCPAMPRYDDLDDADVTAVIAWLRKLPAVQRALPASSCPPLKCAASGADAGASSAACMVASAPDGGVSVPDDASTPIPDADAAFHPDAAHSDPPDAGVVDGTCAVRLNEVQAAGLTADDEFVEIVNPCDRAVDLTGWRLSYRAAAGTRDMTLLRFGPAVVEPGRFLVCAQNAFGGRADVRYSGVIAATGGALALRDDGDQVVDSVGWGTAVGAYVVGTAAPAPPASHSIQRLPDGRDTGDNARDFLISELPTPGASNR